MNGKGSKQRPRAISSRQLDLQWELAFSKPTVERLQEIEKELKEIKLNGNTRNS